MNIDRYLNSKKTVDERARNRRVWDAFTTGLCKIQASEHGPSILDVAGGTGNMALRILELAAEKGLTSFEYTLIDIDSGVLNTACRCLSDHASELGFDVSVDPENIELQRAGVRVQVRLVHGDAFEVLPAAESAAYDVVITQAWLDLVNIETALERIYRVLDDGGLFYAPLHVNGDAQFVPTVEAPIEKQIKKRYRQSLDERTTAHGLAGGSRTGRRLLTELPNAGMEVAAAGGSDWIVRPTPDGRYPHDEAYFLRCILEFVEGEAKDSEALSEVCVEQWLQKRRRQLEAGALTYVAPQIDIFGRKRR